MSQEQRQDRKFFGFVQQQNPLPSEVPRSSSHCSYSLPSFPHVALLGAPSELLRSYYPTTSFCLGNCSREDSNGFLDLCRLLIVTAIGEHEVKFPRVILSLKLYFLLIIIFRCVSHMVLSCLGEVLKRNQQRECAATMSKLLR